MRGTRWVDSADPAQKISADSLLGEACAECTLRGLVGGDDTRRATRPNIDVDVAEIVYQQPIHLLPVQDPHFLQYRYATRLLGQLELILLADALVQVGGCRLAGSGDAGHPDYHGDCSVLLCAGKLGAAVTIKISALNEYH